MNKHYPYGTVVVNPPVEGEFAALHMFCKGDKLVRSIFIGTSPWGKNRKTSGKIYGDNNGRQVCRDVGLNDVAFFPLLHWLVSHAVQVNDSDSEVVEYCGELALKLKDLGADRNCFPTCLKCSRTEGMKFSKDAKFEWCVSRDLGAKFYCDTACLDCYERRLSELKSQRDNILGRPPQNSSFVDDIIFSHGINVVNLKADCLDDMISAVSSEISKRFD